MILIIEIQKKGTKTKEKENGGDINKTTDAPAQNHYDSRLKETSIYRQLVVYWDQKDYEVDEVEEEGFDEVKEKVFDEVEEKGFDEVKHKGCKV